ncbi:MAG: M12 family metallo-peptidase [Phycisphaerales bacterium]
MTKNSLLLHGATLAIAASIPFSTLASAAAPPRTSRLAQAQNAGEAVPLSLPTLARFDVETLSLPSGNPNSFTATVVLGGQIRVISADLFSLRGPEYQLYTDRGDGTLVPTEAPPIHTYRGSVAGVDDAGVAVSLIDGQLRGFVAMPNDGTYFIQPLADYVPGAAPASHVVYRTDDVVAPPDAHCGFDEAHLSLPDWKLLDEHDAGGGGGGEGGIAGAQPQTVEIAFDADFEFYQANGSSVVNTVNDIETVMNGVDFIYDRDVNIGFEFSAFVVRNNVADPYTTNVMTDLLCEFRTKWNSAPESAIQRDLAQLYTGKSISGTVIGLAWLGAVCNGVGNDCGAVGNLAYSCVESRYTTNSALRQSLSAHEIGHNWNATHCDGNGDCHIMCSVNGSCNGIAGSNLKFGANEVAQIVAYRNNVSCDVTAPLPLDAPFLDQFPNAAIDSTKWTYIDGASTSTAATNEVSGTRSLNLDAAGSGPYDNDEVRTNVIKLSTFPNPQVSLWTEHKGVEAGETLVVEYWSSTGDWLNLGTITSDGVDQNNFVQSIWTVPANGRHDGFRLRLRAVVNETNDDWYVDDVKIDSNANPPPGNDECGNATEIGTGTFPFDTTFATTGTELVSGTCAGGADTAFNKDIWYLLTVPCTGNTTISTCSAASFDTRIAVYTQTCPNSGDTPIACSDNVAGCAGNTSTITLAAFAGDKYLIRVGGASGGGTGTLTVSCETILPPANDDCFSASVIGLGTTAFNTTTANDSIGNAPASCNEGNGVVYKHDIWYLHQATCTGTLTVSTCGTASFDSRISVYQYIGLCPATANVPLLGCSDNFSGCSGSTSLVQVPVTAGMGVLIRIGSAGAGGSGSVTLSCGTVAPPCPADLNHDGKVDGADLATLLGAWGTNGADLNGNGTTDAADLAVLLGAWGNCP